jgi:YfiH family protein
VIRWEVPGYAVFFTTREGGVSEGPFASLNLARMSGDAPESVEENRRRLCAATGSDPARLAMNRQQHTTLVHRAQPGARGEPGDGLWTDEPGLPMLKLTADCIPIAIARRNGRPALAVLHAGWRGLLEGIVTAGVEALGKGPLAAAIGPAVGPCCYEVGPEVADPFVARFGSAVVHERRLDLWACAELALRTAGVGPIERIDFCTVCNPERFFSHRRSGQRRGAQGVVGVVAG